MPSRAVERLRGEVAVDVDEDGAGDVALREDSLGAGRAAGRIPSDVRDDDLVPMLGEPPGRDEQVVHRSVTITGA
jgi:hypothetical protein